MKTREFVSFDDMVKKVEGKSVTVLVDSWGYTEKYSFSGRFEPFRHKRQFTFVLSNFDNEMYWLTHVSGNGSWLAFEREEDESFYFEDGHWHCDDPDLFTRPDDDAGYDC